MGVSRRSFCRLTSGLIAATSQHSSQLIHVLFSVQFLILVKNYIIQKKTTIIIIIIRFMMCMRNFTPLPKHGLSQPILSVKQVTNQRESRWRKESSHRSVQQNTVVNRRSRSNSVGNILDSKKQTWIKNMLCARFATRLCWHCLVTPQIFLTI